MARYLAWAAVGVLATRFAAAEELPWHTIEGFPPVGAPLPVLAGR